MKKITAGLISFALLAGAVSAPVFAQPGRTVSLVAGQAAQPVQGSIKGDELAEYVLRARAGQTLTLGMSSSNAANYFNLLAPGSSGEALANGSLSGNRWSGVLPVDGDYRVRVYLMRSAARRHESARFTLTLSLQEGTAAAAPALHHDAKVAGTPYHAMGTVPCSVGPDPKGSAQCAFGVIRKGNGRADVHLAMPGRELADDALVLSFDGSRVAGNNARQRVFGRHHGDEWEISVNDFYFFNVPDAVINGG
jgi:hypothetical protein